MGLTEWYKEMKPVPKKMVDTVRGRMKEVLIQIFNSCGCGEVTQTFDLCEYEEDKEGNPLVKLKFATKSFEVPPQKGDHVVVEKRGGRLLYQVKSRIHYPDSSDRNPILGVEMVQDHRDE